MSLSNKLLLFVQSVGLDIKDLFTRVSTLENNPGGGLTGPLSTTDGHVALWDGTSGNVLKSGGALHQVATTGNYQHLTQLPTLGTAAARNIPSSGNAAGTEVVVGNDTRLTNARTPLSHTHDINNETTGQLSVANGGTGGNSQATAQTNLNVPSRTGSGASGTWGISITGSAASASTAGTATVLATARSFSVSGAVSGSGTVTFTGNGNYTIPVTTLDVGHSGVTGSLGIDHGGTAATTAAAARTNLGVPPINAASMTGGLTLTTGDMTINSGRLSAASGMRCKRGLSGAYGTNNHYFYWTGTVFEIWVDTTNVGSFQGSSDERIKHNVKVAKRSSIFLDNIAPIRYQHKSIGIWKKGSGRYHLGFSAQNLLKACPEAVNGEPDAVNEDGTPAPLSVNTTPIVAALVMETKWLHQQLLVLQEELAALKKTM